MSLRDSRLWRLILFLLALLLILYARIVPPLSLKKRKKESSTVAPSRGSISRDGKRSTLLRRGRVRGKRRGMGHGRRLAQSRPADCSRLESDGISRHVRIRSHRRRRTQGPRRQKPKGSRHHRGNGDADKNTPTIYMNGDESITGIYLTPTP